VIHSLSEEFDGRARIAKVDVDANQGIAAKYGIRSIPTVILFDKGQVVDTFIGVRPKSDYSAALEKTVT
jgi:thioredoxin 1